MRYNQRDTLYKCDYRFVIIGGDLIVNKKRNRIKQPYATALSFCRKHKGGTSLLKHLQQQPWEAQQYRTRYPILDREPRRWLLAI